MNASGIAGTRIQGIQGIARLVDARDAGGNVSLGNVAVTAGGAVFQGPFTKVGRGLGGGWTWPTTDGTSYLKFLRAAKNSCPIARERDMIVDAIGTAAGSGAFVGGVLMADGRVVVIPYNSTVFQLFTHKNNAFTSIGGATSPGSGAFYGGVLMPDGRVLAIPHNSTTARILDHVAFTLSTPTGTYAGNGAFRGGVVLPNGSVLFVPYNSTTAVLYDPVANSVSTPAAAFSGTASHSGGVLLPDGRVLLVPCASAAALYDWSTQTVTTLPDSPRNFESGVLLADGRVFLVPSGLVAYIFDPVTLSFTPVDPDPISTRSTDVGKFSVSACLLPDGRVFLPPYNSTTARVYDPQSNTLTTTRGTVSGSAQYAGAVLMPNGAVFMVPHNATAIKNGHCGAWGTVRLSTGILTSPYMNKL